MAEKQKATGLDRDMALAAGTTSREQTAAPVKTKGLTGTCPHENLSRLKVLKSGNPWKPMETLKPNEANTLRCHVRHFLHSTTLVEWESDLSLDE